MQAGDDDLTYRIIGAGYEVHNRLGPGFLEPVYQEALALEFAVQEIPFEREVSLPIFYREQRLQTGYRADFLCFSEVVVELKALRALGGPETAQLMNYLKATGLRRGLLLNFGSDRMEVKRWLLGH
ncbi:MAG: GxxExxY protein [Flavobacteriales bacterium]|nr:MAG: GxxExxY protein [Flavobacteriales bacterium]